MVKEDKNDSALDETTGPAPASLYLHNDSFVVPVRTKSLNQSGRQMHWGQRSTLSKKAHSAVGWMVKGRRLPALPCVVTLQRVAPSSGLDDDNLRGSLKFVRDAIAKWLGLDDRDPRIEWRYGQERGQRGFYAVRVTVQG